MGTRRTIGLFALCVSATGCGDHFDTAGAVDAAVADADHTYFRGAGFGEPCGAGAACRDGLVCQEGTCGATGDKGVDERCLLTAECGTTEDGVPLQCGWAGFCVEGGAGGESSQCSSSADCAAGFFCELSGGLAGHCSEVSGDAGDIDQPCEATSDCLSGLVCSPGRGLCTPGSVLLNPDVFRGVPCFEDEEAAMDFGIRHALPGGPDDAGFYGFPFPTDVRLVNGRVDISDHPVPGDALIGKDPSKNVIDAINAELTGWSVNAGVYFRFTRPIDVDSLKMRFVNLDTGRDHPHDVTFVPERNKYICHNHLYVHPKWSEPLRPSTTYAVVITDEVNSASGADAKQLDALPMLLGGDEPNDATEKKAWAKYAPLRAWLTDKGVNPDRIAGATVFTTENPYATMEATRAVAHADAMPELVGEPVLCEAGTRSPCASPGLPAGVPDPRDCPESVSGRFHEIHAKIRLPVYQRGTRPYLEEGGDIELDGGVPRIQGHEDVCVSFTIPKEAPMPAGGWPLVIYGHGTSGSFRNHVSLLAPGIANLELADGRSTNVATMGIDQSMHGPRQGAEQGLDPGPLFFNVGNPKAARGNVFQGAADNFSLVRFARDFEGALPGAGTTRFDPDRVYYDGHSQGGTTGPLFAPYEDDIGAAAFSGCAGSLVFSMIGKKSPYDSSVGVRLALQELDITEAHPVLHLFQFYFDAVDPLIYAPLLYKRPAGAPLPTLHVYGRTDSFTPDIGQRAYAAATGGTLAIPASLPDGYDLIEDYGMKTAEAPLADNFESGDDEVTAVTIQYFPDGEYDGHFVAQRHPQALLQLSNYLGTAILSGPPTVVAP